MTTPDYIVECRFVDADNRELDVVRHACPPRVGDHVNLKIGGEWSLWLVVGVWWEYPDPESNEFFMGQRGGVAQVICSPAARRW